MYVSFFIPQCQFLSMSCLLYCLWWNLLSEWLWWVSDVLGGRETVTVKFLNDNKQKELKDIEIGLHMKCWNPHVLCKCVLFVCSNACVRARMGVMLSVWDSLVAQGWWRGFDGLEQLQLIFKMHLLKTTRKCLAGLNLKQCNQVFKAPTASKFQN